MSRQVTFIDTSVLVEVLKVPGKSQHSAEVTAEMRRRVEASQSMILPTAAIIETGNHMYAFRVRFCRRNSGVDGVVTLVPRFSRRISPPIADRLGGWSGCRSSWRPRPPVPRLGP